MSSVPLLNDHVLKPEKRPLDRFRAHLTEDLSTSWGDGMLILHCFVTGVLDSAVFNVWSCFVSMQTGISIIFSSLFSQCLPLHSLRHQRTNTLSNLAIR